MRLPDKLSEASLKIAFKPDYSFRFMQQIIVTHCHLSKLWNFFELRCAFYKLCCNNSVSYFCSWNKKPAIVTGLCQERNLHLKSFDTKLAY